MGKKVVIIWVIRLRDGGFFAVAQNDEKYSGRQNVLRMTLRLRMTKCTQNDE